MADTLDLERRLQLQPEDIGGPSRMDMLRERKEAADALASQRQRVEELEYALRLCDRYCEHLDHAPGKRFHKAGEPCPVEKIINAALARKPG